MTNNETTRALQVMDHTFLLMDGTSDSAMASELTLSMLMERLFSMQLLEESEAVMAIIAATRLRPGEFHVFETRKTGSLKIMRIGDNHRESEDAFPYAASQYSRLYTLSLNDDRLIRQQPLSKVIKRVRTEAQFKPADQDCIICMLCIIQPTEAHRYVTVDRDIVLIQSKFAES